MELPPATLLTLGTVVAGISSTWALLSYRVRALERGRAELTQAREDLAELAKTVEFVRTDQGRRIGDLGDQVKELRGEVRGFRDGFGAGRRSRTAAQGHKVGGDDHG